jgi:tetratricopeptide (TPR) repeat protein
LKPNEELAFNNRGMAYVLQRDYQSAQPDFDRALELRPDKIAPRVSRCALRVILGNLEGALADCNVVLGIQKHNPLALENRGLVYLKLNDLDAAISDYGASLAINPKMEGSLYGRGLAEFRKGDRAASLRDIADAKSIDPEVADEFAEIGLPAPAP